MSSFRQTQEPTFSTFSRELESNQIEESSFLHTQDDIFNLAGALSYGDQVAELTKVWMDERNAPEVLKYRRDLVESLLDAVEKQVNVTNRFIYYNELTDRINSLKRSLKAWSLIQIVIHVLFTCYCKLKLNASSIY